MLCSKIAFIDFIDYNEIIIYGAKYGEYDHPRYR
jgi:hypothetical protein